MGVDGILLDRVIDAATGSGPSHSGRRGPLSPHAPAHRAYPITVVCSGLIL